MVMSHFVCITWQRSEREREREREKKRSEWLRHACLYSSFLDSNPNTSFSNQFNISICSRQSASNRLPRKCVKPDRWVNWPRITYSKDFQSFFQFTLNLHWIDPCLMPTVLQITGQMKGHLFCSFFVIILQTFADFDNRRHSTVSWFHLVLQFLIREQRHQPPIRVN